jgi:glyoxylase-like metal-dependent hydrolase (beta-lactamase superfamily II)
LIRRILKEPGQVLLILSLLLYPALVGIAAAGWELAFGIVALATLAFEAALPRRAPVLDGVLGLADTSSGFRSVVRSLSLVLVVATASGSVRDTVIVAIGMVVLEAMRAGQTLLKILIKHRRSMHIVTRNMDVAELKIPDLHAGFAERFGATGTLYLSALPIIGVIVTAASGQRSAVIVGAIVGAAVALALTGIAALNVARSRGMPSPKAVTAVVRQRLAEYAPDAVVYFSGSADSVYQVNMWLDLAAKLNQRVLILLRERAILERLGPTTVPVICIPSSVDLMKFDIPSVRIALYPTNVGKNIHFLRLPGIAHIFIGHGDSDKVASINPFCKVYDEVWVAGPAGRERFVRAAIGVDDDDVFEVGRPQLSHITRERTDRTGPLTVLYAPTWEGWTDVPGNSSLMDMGPEIVQRVLSHPDDVRLIYKPHPLTGTRSAHADEANRRIIAMIDAANAQRAAAAGTTVDGIEVQRAELRQIRDAIHVASADPNADEAMVARDSAGRHADATTRAGELTEQWHAKYWASEPDWMHRVVTDALPTLFECFNQSDVLVSDISGVVADFLYSEKPYVVTNSAGVDHTSFRAMYPTAAAAELLDPDCATLSEIITAIGSGHDRFAEQRRKLAEHLLGADDPDPLARFRSAMDRVMAAIEGTPRPPLGPMEADPGPADAPESLHMERRTVDLGALTSLETATVDPRT